jgi:hypothetical protein
VCKDYTYQIFVKERSTKLKADAGPSYACHKYLTLEFNENQRFDVSQMSFELRKRKYSYLQWEEVMEFEAGTTPLARLVFERVGAAANYFETFKSWKGGYSASETARRTEIKIVPNPGNSSGSHDYPGTMDYEAATPGGTPMMYSIKAEIMNLTSGLVDEAISALIEECSFPVKVVDVNEAPWWEPRHELGDVSAKSLEVLLDEHNEAGDQVAYLNDAHGNKIGDGVFLTEYHSDEDAFAYNLMKIVPGVTVTCPLSVDSPWDSSMRRGDSVTFDIDEIFEVYCDGTIMAKETNLTKTAECMNFEGGGPLMFNFQVMVTDPNTNATDPNTEELLNDVLNVKVRLVDVDEEPALLGSQEYGGDYAPANNVSVHPDYQYVLQVFENASAGTELEAPTGCSGVAITDVDGHMAAMTIKYGPKAADGTPLFVIETPDYDATRAAADERLDPKYKTQTAVIKVNEGVDLNADPEGNDLLCMRNQDPAPVTFQTSELMIYAYNASTPDDINRYICFYTLTVEIKSTSYKKQAAIVVVVQNSNDAPTLPKEPIQRAMPENSPALYEIGKRISVDGEVVMDGALLPLVFDSDNLISGVDQTFTFNLVDDPYNGFAINSETGDISVKEGTTTFGDFEDEANRVLKIKVSVTDSAFRLNANPLESTEFRPLTSEVAEVHITLADVNESPSVGTSQVWQVDENSPPGTLVKPSTVGGEGSSVPADATTLQWSDPDVERNTKVTWELLTEECDDCNKFSLTEAGVLSVVDIDGAVGKDLDDNFDVPRGFLNFDLRAANRLTKEDIQEGTQSFVLPVQVCDQDDTGPLCGNDTITVMVRDVDEPAELYPPDESTSRVDENTGGVEVAALCDASMPWAVDPENKALTYEIVNVTGKGRRYQANKQNSTDLRGEIPTETEGDTRVPTEESGAIGEVEADTKSIMYIEEIVEGAFDIDENTGCISVLPTEGLDHEQFHAYEIMVRVSDGNIANDVTTEVTVNVDNVNEAPTIFYVPSAQEFLDEKNLSISEYAAPRAVGNFYSCDQDVDGTTNFRLESSTGHFYEFETGATSKDLNEVFKLRSIDGGDAGGESPRCTSGVCLADYRCNTLYRVTVWSDLTMPIFCTEPMLAAANSGYPGMGNDGKGNPCINRYPMNITAIDGEDENLSHSALLVIDKLNEFFPPVVEAASFALSEYPDETLVGEIGSITATDRDITGADTDTEVLSYRVSSSYEHIFRVENETGKIYLTENFRMADRNTFSKCGQQPRCSSACELDFECRPSIFVPFEVSDSRFATEANITFMLTNTDEPPFFGSNSSFVSLSMDEDASPGDVVKQTGGAIIAQDLDLNEQATVRYELKDIDDGTGSMSKGAERFTIEHTGHTAPVLKLKAGMSLNYEDTQAWDFAIVAYSGIGKEQNATLKVTVAVVDINEAPVAQDMHTFDTKEDSNQGTVVGSINATDPDVYRDTQLSYNITNVVALCAGWDKCPEQTGESVFDIKDTGAIELVGSLDYEKVYQYRLTVSVTDEGGKYIEGEGDAGLMDTTTVTVNVIDVNDMAITVIAGATRMHTAGNDLIILNGTNFVPMWEKEDSKIQVTYGPAGNLSLYRAEGCAFMGDSNKLISCKTSKGAGEKHFFAYTVKRDSRATSGTWSCRSADATSYHAPTISSLSGDAMAMKTTGGSIVTITGTQFGPIGTVVSAWIKIGTGLPVPNCAVVVANTKIVCTTIAGIGVGVEWRLLVEGQQQEGWSTEPSSFLPPAITNIKLDTATNPDGFHSTKGGEIVWLFGTNFGPREILHDLCTEGVCYNSDPVVTYGFNGTDYVATDCVVSFDHTILQCTTIEGVGSELVWKVTVGDQTSEVTAKGVAGQETSYRAPAITRLEGSAIDGAILTDGGQQIVIKGTDLGKDASTIVIKYGESGVELTANSATGQSNCRLVVPHEQYECVTIPGTGVNLTWTATVGHEALGNSLQSVQSKGKTSYGQPVIHTITDALGNAVNQPTEGAEAVLLNGRNFGPASLSLQTFMAYGMQQDEYMTNRGRIDDITYGECDNMGNCRNYTAYNCSITRAHKQIKCLTAAGVGSQQRWVVTIAGQSSTNPKTAYQAPVITSITGVGATASNTQGGDLVTISGNNFGTNADLQSEPGAAVTYGFTAEEHKAAGCTVTVDHHQIVCTTIPAYGKNLMWKLKIGGQQTIPNLEHVSHYGMPTITAVSPATGNTRGGARITVQGTNFGTFGDAFLRWEATDHAGRVTGSTTYTGTINPVTQGRGVDADTVKFTVPAGYGNYSVFVQVGDSALQEVRETEVPIRFEYSHPTINYVSKGRNSFEGECDVTSPSCVVYDVLHVMGQNFGPATDPVTRQKTGKINLMVKPTATGQAISWPCERVVWDHKRVSCYTSNIPGCEECTGEVSLTVGENMDMAVIASPLTSNTVKFDSFQPKFWAFKDAAEAFYKYKPSNPHFAPKSFKPTGAPTPRPTYVGEEYTDTSDEFVASAFVDTFGNGTLQVKGTDFGEDPKVLVGGRDCAVEKYADGSIRYAGTEIETVDGESIAVQTIMCMTPEGMGPTQAIEIFRKNGPTTWAPLASEPAYLDYQQPDIDFSTMTFVTGGTDNVGSLPGGAEYSTGLTYLSSTDYGFVEAADPAAAGLVEYPKTSSDPIVINSAGATGLSVSGSQLGLPWDGGQASGDEEPSSTVTVTGDNNQIFACGDDAGYGGGCIKFQNHTDIVFDVPPGEGKDVKMNVTIGGYSATTTFNYGVPVISEVLIDSARTVVELADDAYGFAVATKAVTLKGQNFGLLEWGEGKDSHKIWMATPPASSAEEPTWVEVTEYAQTPDEILAAAVDDSNSVTVTPETDTWSHDECSLRLPMGVGTEGAIFKIEVAAQSSVFFAPNVSSVVITKKSSGAPNDLEVRANRPRTAGGAVVTIEGFNFVGVAADKVKVFIGDKPCPLLATGNTETRLSCTVPAGLGKSQALKVTAGPMTSVGYPIDYLPPTVTKATVFGEPGQQFNGTSDDPIKIPTVGSNLTILGDNFGEDMSATLNGEELYIPPGDHTEISFVIPAGEGPDHLLVLSLAGQSNIVHLDYSTPVISAITSDDVGGDNMGRTDGTTKLTITGKNFGRDGLVDANGTVSWHTVMVDGQACKDVLIVDDHTKITCTAPEWQGANLGVVVEASNVRSTDSFKFSYRAPVVTAVSPNHGPASGESAPYNAFLVTLTGDNFGNMAAALAGNFSLEMLSSDNSTWETVYNTQDSDYPRAYYNERIAGMNASLSNTSLGTLAEIGHKEIKFKLPADKGFGGIRFFRVTTAGQTTQAATAPFAGPTFTYDAPNIQLVSKTVLSTLGFDATGEEAMLTITGASFGETTSTEYSDSREVEVNLYQRPFCGYPQACFGESTGPCISINLNGVCFEKQAMFGKMKCPAGTVECIEKTPKNLGMTCDQWQAHDQDRAVRGLVPDEDFTCRSCQIIEHDQYTIKCKPGPAGTLPTGEFYVGVLRKPERGNKLVVDDDGTKELYCLDGSRCALSTPIAFQYDPPSVASFSGLSKRPNPNSDILTITGQNFGFANSDVEVVLSTYGIEKPLDNAEWHKSHETDPDLQDPYLTADMSSLPAAFYNVSLRVNGQTIALTKAGSARPQCTERCSGCWGHTTGGCQDVNNGVCYEKTATTDADGNTLRQCPPNTLACVNGHHYSEKEKETFDATANSCYDPETGEVDGKTTARRLASGTEEIVATGGYILMACDKDHFGQLGMVCKQCPEGADCTNSTFFDGTLFNDPVSMPGFYMKTVSSAKDSRCKDEQDGATDGVCFRFTPCDPPEACVGSNACLSGYSGESCGKCAEGFFRISGSCEGCPQCPQCVFILFLLGLCVAFAVGHFFSSKKINMGMLSIGIDYFQVLSILAMSKAIKWPARLRSLFNVLSIFNLNLDLMAPECSYTMPYETKWFLIMSLPILTGSMFFLIHIYIYSKKRFSEGRTKDLNRHLPLLIGNGLACFYLFYLYLTKTSLDIFNCSATTPPSYNDDGMEVEYLEVAFEPCYEEGGMHLRLLGPAVMFFILYSIGYPIFVGFMLYKNRVTVMEDQVLRAKKTGTTRATNPNCWGFRKRYAKMYKMYKPEFYFWGLCIMARKLFIATSGLLFRDSPVFLLAFILLVLFIAYSAQVKFNPFMHELEFADVIKRDQERNAGLHEVDLNRKSSDKKMKKKVKAGAHRGSMMDVAAKKGDDISEAFYNYNSIESTLLFCLCLVTLSGLMFQSDQIKPGDRWEYGLSAWTFVIISLSITYFFAVFGTEVAVGLGFLTEEEGNKVMGKLLRRFGGHNAEAHGSTKAKTKELEKKASAPGDEKRPGKGSRSTMADMRDSEELQFASNSNPMFAKQHASEQESQIKKQEEVIRQQAEVIQGSKKSESKNNIRQDSIPKGLKKKKKSAKSKKKGSSQLAKASSDNDLEEMV